MKENMPAINKIAGIINITGITLAPAFAIKIILEFKEVIRIVRNII